MASCAAYLNLRAEWEAASREEGSEAREWAAGRLRQLQLHMEICPGCVAQFWASFPETQGRERRMIKLLELEANDDHGG
jgi:hypothetical protein